MIIKEVQKSYPCLKTHFKKMFFRYLGFQTFPVQKRAFFVSQVNFLGIFWHCMIIEKFHNNFR